MVSYLKTSLDRAVARHGAPRVVVCFITLCEHHPTPVNITYMNALASLLDQLELHDLIKTRIHESDLPKYIIRALWAWMRTAEGDEERSRETYILKLVLELIGRWVFSTSCTLPVPR